MMSGEINVPSARTIGMHSRLVVMLIVAFLPVFAFVIYALAKDQDERLLLAGSNLRSVAQLSALGTERTVEGARQLLGVVTSGPSLKSTGLTSLCTEFLGNIRSTYPNYANVGFLDVEGNVLCDSMRQASKENAADRTYFQRALASRSFAIGEYQVGRITGRESITFSSPVFDNGGALKGVAFAALDLKRPALDLQIAIPSNVRVTITDRKGTILWTDMSQGGAIGSKYPDAVLHSAMKTLPTDITEASDARGDKRLYSVAAVGDGSQPALFVIASIAREAVTAPARRESVLVLLLFALWVALGFGLARWIGNKTLVLPTRRLLGEIGKLAGDDPLQGPATRKNADEIGALSSAIHRLGRILKMRSDERDGHEAELRVAQDRLLSAQHIGKIGNWEFEVQSRQFWWSDQTYAIYEQAPESFIPTPSNVAAQIFPEDRERCKVARHNFSEGTTQLDIEYRIVTGTGRVRWIHDLGESRINSRGLKVFSGAVQDITARVRNERLLASEAQALKVLSLGLPLQVVLEEFLLGLETILPGALTAVNLLSSDSTRLRAGAGPRISRRSRLRPES